MLLSFSALESATNIQDGDFLVFQRSNSNAKNGGQVKISWSAFKTELEAELDAVVGNLDVSGTLTVDTISEHTAAAGITIEGVSIKDGGIIYGSALGNVIAGFYNTTSAQNTITAGTGGAISVNNYLTIVDTDAGGDAFTLTDGLIGQLKKIRMGVDGGGDAVITPATAVGFTTITMNDANDFVILIMKPAGWFVLENSGCTVA